MRPSASARLAPPGFLIVFPGNFRTRRGANAVAEHPRQGAPHAIPVRPHPDRRRDAEEPHRHGPSDPISVGRRTHPGPDGRAVLRAARLGRPDRQRGDVGHADGRGLRRYPRHLVGGPGGRLEADHEGGARRRRPDLHAAVACGPDLGSEPAGRQAARLRQRGRGQGRCQPAAAQAALSGSPCAIAGGDRRGRGSQSQGRRERQGGGLRRGRASWRQRLPAGPVPAGRIQPAHRRLRGVDREPGAADAGSGGRSDLGLRARACRPSPGAARRRPRHGRFRFDRDLHLRRTRHARSRPGLPDGARTPGAGQPRPGAESRVRRGLYRQRGLLRRNRPGGP